MRPRQNRLRPSLTSAKDGWQSQVSGPERLDSPPTGSRSGKFAEDRLACRGGERYQRKLGVLVTPGLVEGKQLPLRDFRSRLDMKRKASVIIVERLPLFREALARLLEGLGTQVVGQTATLVGGLEYLTIVTPELFVLDRDALPQNVSVTAAVHTLSALSANTRIVLLFGRLDRLEVRQARRAGASGCFLKRDNAATLRRAFNRALTGRLMYSVTAPERAAASHPTSDGEGNRKPSLARLTKRELQVCSCVARGLTAAQTAEMLGIRPKTVEVHRTRLMAKLGIHNRATLTRLAIRENLIPVWQD